MKKRIKNLCKAIAFPVLLVGFATGCGNGNEVVRIMEERDSLRKVSEMHDKRLSAIDELLNTINSALDSVYIEEGLLFVGDNDNVPLDKDDALRNLERYERVLRNQQERIKQLERSFFLNADYPDLQSLTEHMKMQLAEKDAQIAMLRSELSKKDVDIAKLRKQVESQRLQITQQNEAIAELDRRNERQKQALSTQDEIINSCYVLIGSKKDLERKGVVKKKKIVSDAALDKTKFGKVDIRKFREISFQAKRPRILSNMPTSAYVLTTTGKNDYVLKITDPTAFWSISNYLIIQTD